MPVISVTLDQAQTKSDNSAESKEISTNTITLVLNDSTHVDSGDAVPRRSRTTCSRAQSLGVVESRAIHRDKNGTKRKDVWPSTSFRRL